MWPVLEKFYTMNLLFFTQNNYNPTQKTSLQIILTYLVYLIGFASLALSNNEKMAYGCMYLISALQIGRMALDKSFNSLKLVLFTCTIFIFALPGVTLSIVSEIDHSHVFFAYILFGDIILLANRRYTNEIQRQASVESQSVNSRYPLILFFLLVWCSASSLFLPPGKLLNLLAFLVPYSISLVIFEVVLVAGASRRQVVLWLMGYLLTLGIYSFFVWDGFGRLVIAAFAMAPFLVIFIRLNVWPRLSLLVFLSPFVLFASQLVRYENVKNIETAFVGSAGHHYIVTNDIVDFKFYRSPEGIGAFFEQYLLLFTNWIPRDWWLEKPIGVGLWSVDAIYGRQGFSDGYSHSTGFLGELYLTLGGSFAFGFLLLVGTMIFIGKIVSKFSNSSVVPMVVLHINMISYFWGGK
jgi:hypothetical protein